MVCRGEVKLQGFNKDPLESLTVEDGLETVGSLVTTIRLRGHSTTVTDVTPSGSLGFDSSDYIQVSVYDDEDSTFLEEVSGEKTF